MLNKPLKTCFLIVVVWVLCLGFVRGANFADFCAALNQVEASGRRGPILGDNGKSLGPLQIQRAYFIDSRTKGEYKKCAEYPFACDVVRNYLLRYGRQYLEKSDWEACARIHNGGPRGRENKKTDRYWEKVKGHLLVNTRTKTHTEVSRQKTVDNFAT